MQLNKMSDKVVSIPNFSNSQCTHTNSTTIVAILIYSVSTELLDTVLCLLDIYEIMESPSFMQYYVTDFLVFEHDAQFASQNAAIFPLDLLLINNPYPGDHFT